MRDAVVYVPNRYAGRQLSPADLERRKDAHNARVQRWRDRLIPIVNQAIIDEARGQRGSKAALHQALNEALEGLEGRDGA
jgi:glutathione S-transferase